MLVAKQSIKMLVGPRLPLTRPTTVLSSQDAARWQKPSPRGEGGAGTLTSSPGGAILDTKLSQAPR